MAQKYLRIDIVDIINIKIIIIIISLFVISKIVQYGDFHCSSFLCWAAVTLCFGIAIFHVFSIGMHIIKHSYICTTCQSWVHFIALLAFFFRYRVALHGHPLFNLFTLNSPLCTHLKYLLCTRFVTILVSRIEIIVTGQFRSQ